MANKYINRLQIREYDTIHIGSHWDVNNKVISQYQASAIDKYQVQTGQQIFQVGRHSLKATNWVGSLGIGRYCIDVVPKIDTPEGKDVFGSAMENLLHMLRVSGLLPVLKGDIAQLANQEKPLIVAFLELYINKLRFEWQRGPIRQYIRTEDNRPHLKGKLLFQEQIRLNTIHKERFYTSHDEFSADNQLSRTLKAALRICEAQLLSFNISLKARELSPLFDDVLDVEPTAILINKVSVDRTIARFEPLINLARVIIGRVSPSAGEPSEQVYSLMFDMNDVFELFIAAECQVALSKLGYLIRKQVKGKSLLTHNGISKFRLIPDIGVYDRSNIKCLIDTKWKRLDTTKTHKNVSQSDVYQTYAYGKEYDSPEVILLYPKFGNLPEIVADYSHIGVPPNKKILIRTVDVSSSLEQSIAWESLHQSLERIIIGQINQ